MPGTTIRPCPDCGCGFRHGQQHGCPPPALVARARAYAHHADWTFAKTMPDNPHWYVVRQKAWAHSQEAGAGHEALFQLLRWYYVLRWWHERGYRSLDLDSFTYWIMEDGTVINRKPTEAAGWDEH